MEQLFKRLFLLIIHLYQKYISPFLPARCRYYPTCSQYGKQAINWHGAKYGGWLTLKRICSCHPLGGHGIDFVPLPLYTMQFVPCILTNNRHYVYVDRSSYSNCLRQWLKTDFTLKK